MRASIPIDEVRRLKSFLGLTAGEEAWRVVIVDSADELNLNAANALLKSLEEPPRRALFLLVSSEPSRLLATIRSRCRRLDLQPLDGGSLRRAAQAGGRQQHALARHAVGELDQLARRAVAAGVLGHPALGVAWLTLDRRVMDPVVLVKGEGTASSPATS